MTALERTATLTSGFVQRNTVHSVGSWHRCEPANSAPQDGAHGTKRRFQDVRLVKIKRLIGAFVFLGG